MNTLKKLVIALILLSGLFSLSSQRSYAQGVFSILKNDRDVVIGRGDDIVYDFQISNYTGATVTGVVFEDIIPEGTTFAVTAPWVCPGFSNGDIAPEGTVCTYDYGDIADGVVDLDILSVITLTVLNDTLLPSITNIVRALENGTDELATSNVTTPIVLPVVFGQISADPDLYSCTDTIEYDINIENVGLVDADDLILTIEIPDNFEITSSGWSCTGNICTYDYGALNVGETDTVTLILDVVDESLCVTEEITLDLDMNVENSNESDAYETVDIVSTSDINSALKVEKVRSDLKTIEEDEEYIATIKIIRTNDSAYSITNIVINEDLDAQLDNFDDYSFIKAWSEDCDVNGSYNGDSVTEIVNGITLAPGEVCDVYYEVNLKDDNDEDYNVTSVAQAVVLGDSVSRNVNIKFGLKFDNDDKKIQEKEEERIKNDRERGNGDETIKVLLADTGFEIYLNIIIGSVILSALTGYIYISIK